MCEFCKDFDFGTVKCQVDKYGSHLLLANGSTRFEKTEQFKFCPHCGRRLETYSVDGMTNYEAETILISHLLHCAALMPIKWVEENGDDSRFQRAYRMAMDALRTKETE